MARTPRYRCSACGHDALRWAGRCTRCQAYDTIEETTSAAPVAGSRATRSRAPTAPARPVAEVDAERVPERTSTGLAELDRVVGGGLVAGQVLLLSGEPGAGKSTLLLTVADAVARRTGRRVLYVSAEESAEQIAVRARRLGVGDPRLLVADDTDLGAIVGHLDAHSGELALVIVDSVQTVSSDAVDGRAGGVSQVMEVAQTLTRLAKARGVPVCLVGQVTKDSTVAGPRSLEHIVDTTLSLDGDRHTSLRLLRCVKNRFGPADEVACFEQTDTGLREVADPGSLFRGERDTPVPGTCLTTTVEGRRPLLAEVQALVAPTSVPNPRRGVTGLDSSRVAMLVAVTERAARLRIADKDLFVATVGGIRLSDPAADLAVCLAVVSAARDVALPGQTAAIGEVTLSGEVRPVPMTGPRVAEALRLGHRRVLVAPGSRARLDSRTDPATVVEVASLADAARGLRAVD